MKHSLRSQERTFKQREQGEQTQQHKTVVDPPQTGLAAREARQLQLPPQPTKEEMMTHLLTHLPHRTWCKHCADGEGRQSQHERQRLLVPQGTR